MFFNIFTKPRHKVANPGVPDFYAHVGGDVPSPGAESYAFVPKFGNPLFLNSGSGVNIARQFRSVQPPQLMQSLSLPQSPLQGFLAGNVKTVPLSEDTVN